MRMLVWTFLLLSLCLASGCAHRVETKPLNPATTSPGYRFTSLTTETNSNSLLVILAFSGGGTRAAALSYGVLEELARTNIRWEGRQVRLLDEVDIISAVSGGSFTAAYYALFLERIFVDFRAKFLERNLYTALISRLLSSWSLTRVASPWYDRSDLAAAYYDRHIFEGRTYGDLLQNRTRPFLLINATDMSTGARFEFTQDQFDLIGADLSPFPISRAVAASSAYPVMLSPITLDNHSKHGLIPRVETTPDNLPLTGLNRQLARNYDSTRFRDGLNRPFIHLLDGGLSDNLGLRSLLDNVIVADAPIKALQQHNITNAQKVVVIVVSADNEPDFGWERRESSPNLAQVALAAGNIAVRRYNLETIELFRESIERWNIEVARDPSGMRPVFYPIVVSFDFLRNEAERRRLKRLRTTLHLRNEQVAALRAAAGRILREAPAFRDLLRDLGADEAAGK